MIPETGMLELPWRYEFVWEETEEIGPHSADKKQQQGEDRPRDTNQRHRVHK